VKEPPETKTVSVLGATPALLASLQVMEAIKIITGIGKPLVGRLLFIDGEEMTFETVDVTKNIHCSVCGKPKK
jgi:adenylyltransferase/sulfurtransferase